MKYTALTIGPIKKSLGLAHRTKELWAASYFFSYLMQKVVEGITDKEAIVLPYHSKDALMEENIIDKEKIKTAGIFPDRLILQSEQGMYDDLKRVVDEALLTTVEVFNIKNYLIEVKRYLTTYIVEFDNSYLKDNDNFVFRANNYLANCELKSSYFPEGEGFFLGMLAKIESAPVYKEIFKNKTQFPSIIEIATRELNIQGINLSDPDEEEENIWKEVEAKYGDNLKTSHKYIAIVQADGDNVGKIIKQVASSGDSDEILKFSKDLSTFSLKAAKVIADYQGTPIYIGGDDLLFFAPVRNNNVNIFSLIGQIDKAFEETISEKYAQHKPSMSYGISITYHKFPMHEALSAAQKLLFGEAKGNHFKNTIAFKVLKHSGQVFGATMYKPLRHEFEGMLIKKDGLDQNSLIYNLEKHKTILKEVIGNKESLHNFFENFYNEQDHKDANESIGLLEDLLFCTHQEIKAYDEKEIEDRKRNNRYLKPETEEETTDRLFNKTLNQVYAQLRLVKFLNRKYND